MVKIPEFREEDWDQMHEYTSKWAVWKYKVDEDKVDTQQETIPFDAYILPLSITILANAAATEKLTRWLIVLTGILTVLTAY